MHALVPAPPPPRACPAGPHAARAEAPRTVWMAVPPYHALQPVSDASLAAHPVRPGTVLAVPLPPGPATPDRVGGWVARLRAAVPDATWVALAPDGGGDAVAWAQHAPSLGLRAVLVRGRRPDLALRPLLCQTNRLGDEVVGWLEGCGVPLSPNLAHMVGVIFSGAAGHAGLGPLLRARGVSEHGARERFRKKGLPLPKRWHQAARALHAAVALQRDPACKVLEVALALGYSSDSALSRQLQQAFGVRPVQVRGTLGWEWLLHRWLRRAHPAGAS